VGCAAIFSVLKQRIVGVQTAHIAKASHLLMTLFGAKKEVLGVWVMFWSISIMQERVAISLMVAKQQDGAKGLLLLAG